MKGYIYIIRNICNDKVYIGQTSRTIEARWQQHKQAAKRGDNYGIVLYNAMRKYGINNFYISKVEEVNLDQINERQIYWIKFYNSQVPNGYNVRSGGEDPGRKEVYKIDPITNQILECYGSAMTAAEANNLDLSQLTKVCRHQWGCVSCHGFKWSYKDNYDKEKISEEILGRDKSPVCQIDPYSGKLIKEWESVKKAADTLGIERTVIFGCLSGKNKTSGGWNWCRPENLQSFIPKTNTKQVIQYSKNSQEILHIWKNAQEAANALKKNASTIRAAARGKQKTAYGYVWRYKEDVEQ